jgi:phytoene dehydrogenase-like protein
MTTVKTGLYDAIIVGAGPGGSTMAALLAKAGLRILLVDKNPSAGGKMMTVHRDGFLYELFPINAVPSRNSLFEQLIDELDLEKEVETIFPNPVGRFYFELPGGEIRMMEIPYKNPNPLGFKKLLGLSWLGFFKFITMMARMVSCKPEALERLSKLSALDYLNRYNLPRSLKSYLLSVYTEGFFEAPADRVSAAAMIRAVQQTAQFGGGRYYRRGVGSVFEGFVHYIEKHGGTAIFNTRVEKILVENNKVTGIQAGGKRYTAPIVISNAGIQPTVLKLIGESKFVPTYVTWVRGLEMNLANVGFRWFLDKPLLESPMNVYITYNSISRLDDFINMEKGKFPDHSYVYLGTTSLYPGLAPQGKQIVYACMSCLGDPEVDIKPYLERIRKIVVKMQPDILDHIEKEETFGPLTVSKMGRERVIPGKGGEDYGVSLTFSQYGDERLNGASPIKGLYFVGGDAGGFGLGTHQAVDSAVNVSKMILDNHRK